MYKKKKSEARLGSSAISKMKFFVTFFNDFQLLTNVTKKSILDITGVLDPSLIYCEYCKSGQNLAPPSATLIKLQKQLNIVTHQTRDQTAIDLFLFLLVFSSSGEVLSLSALDFYNRGHLHNPHFLSAPLM